MNRTREQCYEQYLKKEKRLRKNTKGQRASIIKILNTLLMNSLLFKYNKTLI